MRNTKKNALTKRVSYALENKPADGGVGEKTPRKVKKATYRIEIAPLSGRSSETDVDADGKVITTQDQGIKAISSLAEANPQAIYDLIQIASGSPVYRWEPTAAPAPQLPAPAEVAPTTAGTDSRRGEKPKIVHEKRPEVYVVQVENLPRELARVKGHQSGRILCGRVEDHPEFNPLKDRLREGEKREISDRETVLDTFVFDTMAGWYYFCVDVKDNLKARGYKSSGNYQKAIWEIKKAGHPVVRVTAVTHLEKITSPDYVPRSERKSATADLTTAIQSLSDALDKEAIHG